MPNFSEITNSSKLTVLLVVIVFMIEVACIQAVGIKSTYTGEDSTGAVSIGVTVYAFIKSVGVRGVDD